PGNNGNANSFCGNIGNNVITTQAVSITNSQGNGFLQSINPFSTSAAPQNRVIHNVTTNSQQQIDFNNISLHITDREMGSFHEVLTRNFAYTWQQVDLNNNCRDTDLYGGNIRNNVMTTQANGLTYDYQDINDIHQSQQQVDFNNNYGNSYNENIENNVTTSQANGLTCDHQNTNDIHQVNHINNNYRGTDSHNENIENNVTTTQANDLTCDHQDINDIHQVNHINNNYEDIDSHNSNVDNNVITTQTNDLACDRQNVSDIHQVTRC
ncbi:20768_t:CDS:2, partial [Rhizophagus irregularis]